MKEELLKSLKSAVSILGIKEETVKLEYPENYTHGDFSSNVALINAKILKTNPRELAEKIVVEFDKIKPEFVESIGIAGAGFINFKLKDEVFARAIARGPTSVGPTYVGPTSVMVEYTDPNPFKEFHIGHLMANAVGESISRLIEDSGVKVIRANWQGDVGPHVAKALWGAMHLGDETDTDNGRVKFWGRAYVRGALAYEDDPEAKKEIEEINKKVYEKSDSEINKLYDKGREVSLGHFEELYKRLGTKFNNYFFEGKEGRNGEAIVQEFLEKGVFEKSEGAVIFHGEKYGLHTRVFVTSNGLPTYETKELGLNKEKFKLYPELSQSIIVTANEQNDYFKVLLKVFSLIDPNIYNKTKHISHGLMRFASGKMSSRKGNVISGEGLIEEIKELVKSKMVGRDFATEEADEVADMVAVGAIKYTILRQSIGSDIIFDSAKSISFEGDSGPYLQYSAVRASSIIEKAKEENISSDIVLPQNVGNLERLISRFSDIAMRAREEYAPQIVANYLIALAGEFNSFYGKQVVVDKKDPLSPYYVALTKVFRETMEKGLWLLGIKVPRKM